MSRFKNENLAQNDLAPVRSSNKASPSDELNREIIRMLQEDGRLPYKDIASHLGVSEGTIRNRVQWMKDANMLKIVALVDPMAIRYKADAMIGIKVSNLSSPAKVADRLAQHAEVVYVVWFPAVSICWLKSSVNHLLLSRNF
ncbi:MAG: AsnC family transcriptional regulator [Gammaproteobacteria bacterium]